MSELQYKRLLVKLSGEALMGQYDFGIDPAVINDLALELDSLQQAGVEIELEKITDMAEIMGYGVMSTPGVVVDGKLVHAGGLPGPDLIRQWVAE